MNQSLLKIFTVLFLIGYIPPISTEEVCSPTDCYTIVQKLGEGFFSQVYEVENPRKEKFALKVYKYRPEEISFGNWAATLAELEREYERGQELDHPNILKSVEYFRDEDQTGYLVLEFVEGKRLGQIGRKELNEEQMYQLINEFVGALEFAESEGFVHTDLHSANVMLDDENHIKVIDLASFFTTQEIMQVMRNILLGTKAKDSISQEKEQKIRNFLERHPTIERQVEVSPQISSNRFAKEIVGPSSFADMTRLCRFIVSNSDIPREQKMEIFNQIERISWEYYEDFRDYETKPTSEYFKQLLQSLSDN